MSPLRSIINRYVIACCASIAAFGLFVPTVSASVPSSAYNQPDFAYPKTVISDADKALEASMKASDSRGMLRALINLSLAEASISQDDLVKVTERIRSLSNSETNEEARSLLKMLLAGIYADIYQSDTRAYDQRPPMLDPLKGNFTTWSGQHISDKIMSLIDEALAPSELLSATPISRYDGVIEYKPIPSATSAPTLLDFEAIRALDILRSFAYRNTRARMAISRIISMMCSQRSMSPEAQIYWQLQKIESDNTLTGDFTDSEATYEKLKALYDRYSSTSAASGEILLKIEELPSEQSTSRSQWLYTESKRFIATYPDYFRANCISNIISNMERKSAYINVPSTIYSGVPVTIELSSRNVTDLTITAYKIDSNYPLRDDYFSPSKSHGRKKAASKTYSLADAPQTAYPTQYAITINDFPALSVGRYVFEIDFSGKDSADFNSQRIVTVTKLATYATVITDPAIYVVDGMSGSPLKDIVMKLLPNRRDNQMSTLGNTDKDGSLMANADCRGRVFATKGNDMSAPFSIWSNGIDYRNRTTNHISSFTSLPLYHQGDTLRWGAVAYSSKGYGHELLEGRKITAIVRDANYEPFDTIHVITDRWGRCNGHAVIPKEGLTGNFSLSLEMSDPSDDKHKVYANSSFTVSDYKLPTYSIVLNRVSRKADGAFVISGKLRTYTDLPVENAEITLDLKSQSPARWWLQPIPQSFYTTSSRSDSEGCFTITVTPTIISEAPYPRGYFMALLTAVSTSGESQSATTGFSPASLHQLSVDMPKTVNTSRPLKLDIKITDIAGEAVDASTVDYEITDGERTVATGTVEPKNPILDLSAIPNGTYDIKFSLDSMTDPLVSSRVIMYNPQNGQPSPTDDNIWTPSKKLVTANDGTTDLCYATGKEVNNVMVIIWNPETGHEYMRKWLKVSPGFNTLPVKLDSGAERVNVSMIATRNFRTDQCKLTISLPEAERKLLITTTSLRDKTAPLAHEKWTFTLRYDDGTPVEGAIIADIYSKALESIKRHNNNFTPVDGQLYNMSLYKPNSWPTRVGVMSPLVTSDCVGLSLPQWQTWGMSWVSRMRDFAGGRMIRGTRMLNAARYESALSEKKMESNAALATSATTDEASIEESADDAGGADADDAIPEEIKYRPSEIALAYFNPCITTDAEGNAVIELTMPDAVTTWQFDMVAFTRKLDTSKYTAAIVSSKPLMVKPNVARFVRAGDCINVLTTVYNKTDSLMDATVYAEATATGGTDFKAYRQIAVKIAPNGSKTVSLPIDVTVAEGSLLTLKTAATSGSFTDGEMSIIPVLSSSSSVIESEPFYIQPDSTSITMTIPEMRDDATVTLQYCENPLWLAVLALPSISDESPNTAMRAADTFLSAISAKNLVAQYPVIAQAVKTWSEGDRSDESLKSMLERNEQLKQMMLQSTPWMREARSDSERMSRLALLLDSDYIDNAIKSSTAKLRQLQASNGAWRWMADNSEPSLWVTKYVLRTLGALNRLGWLPTDAEFNDMLRKAVKYLDDETVSQYARYPKASYIDYAELRNLFNITQSAAAHAVSNAALREARASWKKMTPVEKAKAAILMDTHGYGDISNEVIESLDQYALISPERGMWWDNTDITGQSIILDAYSQLQPRSKSVDRIRQWLIFQKEATDWGDNPQAALIIANLITSSPSWILPLGTVEITLGGKPLTTPKGDSASGMFTMNIPASQASGSVMEIRNSEALPSWGAVIAQYVAESRSVKPHSIPDLSISKETLTGIATAEGMKWTTDSTAAVGSKAKVKLTIVANRDMDYVTIVDQRPACLEPVEQLPGYLASQGVSFYRENRDSQTDLFISRLPKGTYVLTYDCYVNNSGRFTSGIATIQSQMTPSLTAHSGASLIEVKQQSNQIN